MPERSTKDVCLDWSLTINLRPIWEGHKAIVMAEFHGWDIAGLTLMIVKQVMPTKFDEGDKASKTLTEIVCVSVPKSFN